MQPVKTLIRIRHGSHLYGTNTPSSDLDFKGVHLPSGEEIILQRVPNVIDRKIKVSTTLKNTSEDVDDQSYPLHKFLSMVVNGDTNGTEILFAPDAMIEERSGLWEIVWESRHLLLNRQCRGFVGYCQRQAAKYGIKGSRMAACKGIVELLSEVMKFETNPGVVKISTISDLLGEFCAQHEFSRIVDIEQASGSLTPHLEVVDRKVPFTISIKAAYDIYAKVFENYGHRTRSAMDNEGVDWKAVSHAVRVARQALELLTTQHITFPRPDAEELLAIKLGKIDYKVVAPVLESLVEEVEEAAKTSSLPTTSNTTAIDAMVRELYRLQVLDAF